MSRPLSKPAAPAGCPCGGPAYAGCCAPFIDGSAIPPDAETLMRSRYTAYTLGLEDYLRRTWHPSTCPADNIINPDEKLQWLGLEVKSALRLRQRKVNQAPAAPSPDEDTVEFVARYKLGGRAHRLHEISRFVREGGRWLYVDGSFPQ